MFECGIFRRGAKSVADIDTGGPKSLLFDKFTVLSLLFLPSRGGPNSIANFDGGPWPDLPPPGSATGLLYLLYTADIPAIFSKHSSSGHLYADDVQAFVQGPPLPRLSMPSYALA